MLDRPLHYSFCFGYTWSLCSGSCERQMVNKSGCTYESTMEASNNVNHLLNSIVIEEHILQQVTCQPLSLIHRVALSSAELQNAAQKYFRKQNCSRIVASCHTHLPILSFMISWVWQEWHLIQRKKLGCVESVLLKWTEVVGTRHQKYCGHQHNSPVQSRSNFYIHQLLRLMLYNGSATCSYARSPLLKGSTLSVQKDDANRL